MDYTLQKSIFRSLWRNNFFNIYVDYVLLFFLNLAKNPPIKKAERDEVEKNWDKLPQFKQDDRLIR